MGLLKLDCDFNIFAEFTYSGTVNNTKWHPVYRTSDYYDDSIRYVTMEQKDDQFYYTFPTYFIGEIAQIKDSLENRERIQCNVILDYSFLLGRLEHYSDDFCIPKDIVIKELNLVADSLDKVEPE